MPRRLFPRLPVLVAREEWDTRSSLSVSELSAQWRDEHELAVYAATGAPRIERSALRELRSEVEDVVRKLGFPGPRDQRKGAEFDVEVSKALHQKMPIAGGEASREEVWNFLTICLFPDLARWRFPSSGPERFMGGVRNTFQRLWWRAHAFYREGSADPYELLPSLPEDAMVGIMERPGVSANPQVALAMALSAVSVDDRVSATRREDVRRDFFKRVRQRAPVVDLDALSEETRQIEMKAMVDAAVKAAEVRSGKR